MSPEAMAQAHPPKMSIIASDRSSCSLMVIELIRSTGLIGNNPDQKPESSKKSEHFSGRHGISGVCTPYFVRASMG